MGLTIHYQGGINSPTLIPKLIDELEDIAGTMGWESRRVDEDEPEPPFRGIIISPAGDCEPLCFIFDRGGRLRCLADLLLEQIEASEYSMYCAVKTQYAEVETHAWIIGLLHYLKKHYLHDLEVSDEAEFWETGDLAALSAKKQFLQSKIDQLADSLATTKLGGTAPSLEDIVAHLEKIIGDFKRDM